MSRLIATTADEMLSGTNSNVMGQYDPNDDEVPGSVVLASTNMMPNPDLTQVNERGRLRFWDLNAPPTPDSWNVYMKQLTTIGAGNVHKIITEGQPMLRQNESLLRWKEHTYQQDQPLLTNKALPDLGRDEPTDLAPPLDKPRVKVDLQTNIIGYPASSAGALRASYFGILGNHPLTSPRITPAAPSVACPAIAQGQALIFYPPDEIPDSWTGIGFCVGPSDSTMKVQKRVDIRGRVITQVIDKGPYRRDGAAVGPLSTNKTQAGAFKQNAKPKHWRANSDRTLQAANYPIAYELRTEQGWSASSAEAVVEVLNDRQGEVLAYSPPDSALRQPGIQRWRPLFRAKDQNWHTFEDAKENGYPLSRPARLHTRDTGDLWRSSNKAAKSSRSEADHSGVPAPTDPMEAPVATGAEQMSPGKYAVRLTTASQAEGMESRPTPREVFTLRDTGVQLGGAPSGVTDQAVRVWRPPGQTIKNARWVEVDKADGTTELHWERTNPGVTIADSVLTLTLNTGAGIVIYRRSDPEPIDPTKFYSIRFRMNMTAWTSGNARVRLRFLDAAQAAITTTLVEDMSSVQDQHVRYTFGPDNGSANFDIPPTAAFVQAEVVGANTKVFTVSISNLGVFVGRSNPRKLWDLVLAEDTPGKDLWPIPDQETNTDIQQLHYPPGPFVRVVTNPVRPAQHRAGALLERKGFEDGTTTGSGWTAPAPAGGATITVDPAYALQGQYGMRANVSAASALYSAYVWKDFSTHSPSGTFGIEGHARIKTLPDIGSVGIFGVTKTATLTDYLAYAKISSSGAVTLRYLNASSVMTDSPTLVTAKAGDDLKIDFTFTNLGAAGTAVVMRVKLNDRVAVSTATLNTLASAQVNRALVGFFDGTTGATARALLDNVRFWTTGIGELTDIPGSMVEYWAPEGQPAGDPTHLMTGVRYPVKPSTNYVDSVYMAHDGITTPADGADLFAVVSFDSEGNMLQHHGYLATGVKGKAHWDRYYLAYTTPANAAYVEYVKNRVGDGLIWVMGFQHETGTTPTTFINTNATSGSFQVVFKTTPNSGPKDGDVNFNSAILRVRAVTAHVITTDVNGNDVTAAGSTVNYSTRGADTLAGLALTSFGTVNTITAGPSHKYVEVKIDIASPSNTTSPEVRGVFIDVQRDRPVLTRQDGRDFHGVIIVYSVTPASPVPNVVRKEMADGSVSLENVGRGTPPERLKLSLQAFTDSGKRAAEKNPASDQPLYNAEVGSTRYRIAMVPEFTGNAELEPDGAAYYDYLAEDIVADVISTEDL